ncbi:putative DNA double-strand break repair Rad50 ATPase [Candidatus Calditenuaceae archaeon HR02]|nr:putative DNA double-strand break repair Rad50 ATPase [Candidatus Calditenuaceae archaeon HR02]
MVKLLSLYAYNFKKLKFDEPLRFSDGVMLISGLNEAGKSSILDAILYALYARVIRPPPEKGKTRNEDIIAYGASKAHVVLEFAVGDKRYRVRREISRKGKPHANLDEILADNSLKPLAVGQEKVTEQVEAILGGITFNELVSSTVVAQKELNKLIELRQEDRKKIINVFLNLESFNIVLENLEEQKRELEGTKERPGSLRVEKEKLESLRKELEEYVKKKKEREDLVEERMKLLKNIEKTEAEYAEAEKLYKTLQDYDEFLNRRQKLELEIETKRKHLETLRKTRETLLQNIEHMENDLQRYRDLPLVEKELESLSKEYQQLRNLDYQIDEVREAETRLGLQVRSLEQQLPPSAKATALRRPSIRPFASGAAASIIIAFVLLFLGGVLPALLLVAAGVVFLIIVFQRVSRLSRMMVLQETLARLEQAREMHATARATLGNLVQNHSVKTSYLKNAFSSLPRYGELFRQKLGEGLPKAVEAVLQQAVKDRQELNNLKSRLDAYREQLKNLPAEHELNQVEDEIHSLREQLEGIRLPTLPPGLEFSRDVLEETRRRVQQLAENIQAYRTRAELLSQQVLELDEWLRAHGDVEQRYSEQMNVVANLERELAVVRKAVEAVQATAEALRNRVKPLVAAHMGIILPALTNNRYKAAILDDDYRLQVWDPDAGQYRVKEVFSGGTEDQMLLAMRLAFALALLPEAKGQKPEFVFLDEPLGSSDEVRRSGIIVYIALDLTKKFSQIFIISHVGGLEEHVNHIIRLHEGKVVETV